MDRDAAQARRFFSSLSSMKRFENCWFISTTGRSVNERKKAAPPCSRRSTSPRYIRCPPAVTI